MRILFVLSLFVANGFAASALDYARDVRPILSENCFQCHGQDAGTRKGKLRLDTREGQQKAGVIVAGKPESSDLIARIESPHEDERMPPLEAKRTLTDEQKTVLKQWVTEGAPFAEHWAFSAPKRSAAPAVQKSGWARNEIDHFVLARIEAAGLSPAAEADRERWLRRVTFDLTGLPPTLAEMDAFVAEQNRGAHENVVDRLLASTRYGERMAADWLDVARYADTHGYQMDRPRAMWPYRDWVVGAFNRNLPYSQFLTEQVAGDLLPNATRDQRLATAFNRLHAQNEEGGIVDEEYRIAYVNDRVTTFGTAVLGLTLDCARCHDHKFDPVTQRDFYALSAFFQNIDEAGAISYKNFSDVMPPPVLKLPTPTEEAKLAELTAKIQAQEKRATAARAAAASEFETWKNRGGSSLTPTDATLSFDFDAMAEAGVPNLVNESAPAKMVDAGSIGEGRRGGGAVLNGDDGFAIAEAPVVSRGDAFSFSLWLRPSTLPERVTVFHRSVAYADAGSRGYELVLEHGRVVFALHRHWPGDSLKVVSLAAIPADTWTHLTLTYDGSSRAAGTRIYIDGTPAPVEVIRDKLTGDITYDREKQPPLLIGHRFRDNGFKGGRIDDLKMFGREVSPLEAFALAERDVSAFAAGAPTNLTRERQSALKDHYVRAVAPLVQAELTRLAQLRRDYAKTYDAVQDVMVMEELPQPKPAFVLERGAYDQRGAPLTPATPAVLPPMKKTLPRNRLGLAHWATEPANPLTARVAMNRLWQMMFERGLVETTDNFGVTGAMPTHPELLDWLATEFMRSGWDTKAMLRRIALSATYRQSSLGRPEARARDPQNLLLARAPARRLTAEMMRDQALAASGLLVGKLGGPAVKPYQPAGLWEEIAMGRPKYEPSAGEGLYRRSLYTFWKRTVPPPTLVTFDAADRAVCNVRRQATSTPLQALALLNDTQLVEAARFVAVRMLKEGGDTPAAQVNFGFRLVTGRSARAAETKVLERALAEQLAIFAADPAAAAKLLTVGAALAPPELPVERLAAATAVASLLFNHDEAVMRR